MGLKNVTLQGRLVREPETRQSQSGTEMCTFTLAVDSNRKSNGQEKPAASFFRVTAFGKRGASCQQYLNKGDECVVSGDLELDVYQAPDGKTHSNMQVTADAVHFGRKANPSNGQVQQNAPQQRQQVESPIY